jgi:WhiB family transcriptional regulator, redox-sensing transcriptional regulator
VDWVHRARCKDEDPELFFPIGTTGPAATQIEQAKAICMQCDVRAHCLDWALATGQDAGVWGGLSEEERRALRRARRRETASHRMAVGAG